MMSVINLTCLTQTLF